MVLKLEELERASSRPRTTLRARITALAVILVIVTSFVVYSAEEVEWKVDRVDGVSGIAYWPFVATDESGLLHMTCYVGGSLTHSVLTDDGWKHSTVVSGPVHGASPLVFDNAGNPCICYQVQGGGALNSDENYTVILAEKNGDEWAKSVITCSSMRGSHSIALDASGDAHIAFIRSGDIVCTNNANSSWTETLLLDVSDVSYPPLYDIFGMTSVAIDPSDHPHVAVGYNRGFIGVYSKIDGAWNLSTLFNWDLTSDSVSMDIADDGTMRVGYWGYPKGEPSQLGIMLATNIDGNWSISPVHPRESYTSMFRCAVSVAPDDSIKMAVEMCDDAGYHLGTWTSSPKGWKYSDVTGSGNPLNTHRSQMSICFSESDNAIVPVSSGSAGYATDSPGFLDRLASVSLVALASYFVGFVVWVTVVKIGQSVSNRSKDKASGQ